MTRKFFNSKSNQKEHREKVNKRERLQRKTAREKLQKELKPEIDRISRSESLAEYLASKL